MTAPLATARPVLGPWAGDEEEDHVTYEQLIVDIQDGVAVLRLNNPARLNALSREMTAEMVEALSALREDGEVRALVLTGQGRGFCSGADLTSFGEAYLRGEPPKPSGFLREGYNRLIPLITETPKPFIAAVNGIAAGAGASLALACDLRIASDTASFSMAFVRIGLVPDSGASLLLPRTVGMAKALELAMLSDRIDVASALSLGMLNRVVPADSLMEEAMALARRLAVMPTAAIGLTKRLFQESASLTLPQALEHEAQIQDQAAATHDHVEGVLAFLQKRQPIFTGR